LIVVDAHAATIMADAATSTAASHHRRGVANWNDRALKAWVMMLR